MLFPYEVRARAVASCALCAVWSRVCAVCCVWVLQRTRALCVVCSTYSTQCVRRSVCVVFGSLGGAACVACTVCLLALRACAMYVVCLVSRPLASRL